MLKISLEDNNSSQLNNYFKITHSIRLLSHLKTIISFPKFKKLENLISTLCFEQPRLTFSKEIFIKHLCLEIRTKSEISSLTTLMNIRDMTHLMIWCLISENLCMIKRFIERWDDSLHQEICNQGWIKGTETWQSILRLLQLWILNSILLLEMFMLVRLDIHFSLKETLVVFMILQSRSTRWKTHILLVKLSKDPQLDLEILLKMSN